MFDLILHPFAVAITWVWVMIHRGLVAIGFSGGSGVAWVISIILVTIVVRILIIPLFLKQIKSSRGMQAIQPEMKKIQEKYRGKTDPLSRQKMAEETQSLYKKHGTSPFASCLPVLVQMPILFGMYQAFIAVKLIADGVYTYRGEAAESLGPIDQTLAKEIDGSTVMGVQLSNTIGSTSDVLGIATFIVLIATMVTLQFLSMRMMLVRNMPPVDDPNNPMVRSQKLMMYMMPAMFIATGFVFQMGLLVYMVTGTVWALAQQLWTLHYMPTPGSPAYLDLVAKRQSRYQSWAKEFFTTYDAERTAVSGDTSAVEELNARTRQTLVARGKSAKIASDFPAELSDGEVITIYRNLAHQEWTTLPDELWMRGVKRQTERNLERRAQQGSRREQPRRQSKAQRKAAAEHHSDSGDATNPAGLSPEELERRRQARRKAQRDKKKGR
ncbi:membrane protein insertase YidC [Schaalia canis]|uniref:Membrane protein insertase YidC n=1 Tax=Schaalia canis TaxID=100469 RepID=A0A3P1SE04_9ACTO|nr:membrane protein insertase YidC [Schaalia canis]RRC95378.1 membrane protein insertase YidC [Schaalia canis]